MANAKTTRFRSGREESDFHEMSASARMCETVGIDMYVGPTSYEFITLKWAPDINNPSQALPTGLEVKTNCLLDFS